MWTYSQSTGKITKDGTVIFGLGYSGKGQCKNDPNMQQLKGLGPIPRGRYTISSFLAATSTHGPDVLVLVPDAANQMFGRSGFLIHGDSKEHPGDASEGCIILSSQIRLFIWASRDHILEVVE